MYERVVLSVLPGESLATDTEKSVVFFKVLIHNGDGLEYGSARRRYNEFLDLSRRFPPARNSKGGILQASNFPGRAVFMTPAVLETRRAGLQDYLSEILARVKSGDANLTLALDSFLGMDAESWARFAPEPAAEFDAPSQVFAQNERYWLLVGWQAATGLLLEPAAWDNGQKDSNQGPAPTPEFGIQSECDTDADGWKYGFDWWELGSQREGGRASRRATDFVRRRMWVPKAAMVKDERPPNSERQGSSQLQRAGQAWGIFSQLLKGQAKKSGSSQIHAMDPAALIRHSTEDAKLYKSFVGECVPLDNSPGSTVLISSLLAACYFAKAAYGYAQIMGHMDSLGSWMRMMTVQKLAVDVTSDIDDETNNDAAAKLAGLHAGDILLSNWEGGTFHPAFFVSVDPTLKWVVIAVRGTLSSDDILTDVCGSNSEFGNGLAHSGIEKAARHVLRNVLPIVESMGTAYAGYSLICTGHSLGAGVAAMLTILLRQQVGIEAAAQAKGYCFAPPAVVDATVADSCTGFVTSVVNGKDIIPRLSTGALDRMLQELNDASNMQLAKQMFGFAETAGAGAGSCGPEMFPPGQLLHLDATCRPEPTLHYVTDRSAYLRILLSANLVDDHLACGYESRLQHVLQVAAVTGKASTGGEGGGGDPFCSGPSALAAVTKKQQQIKAHCSAGTGTRRL
jgi:hypothetical protein